MEAKIVLVAKPKNVRLAREWVFDNCRQFGLRGSRAIDIKTITSEVVTNVIKHAYNGQKNKKFILKAKSHSNKITITVKDFGMGFKSHRSRSLHVGLLIVEALADNLNVSSFYWGTKVTVSVYLKDAQPAKPVTARRFGLLQS